MPYPINKIVIHRSATQNGKPLRTTTHHHSNRCTTYRRLAQTAWLSAFSRQLQAIQSTLTTHRLIWYSNFRKL